MQTRCNRVWITFNDVISPRGRYTLHILVHVCKLCRGHYCYCIVRDNTAVFELPVIGFLP